MFYNEWHSQKIDSLIDKLVKIEAAFAIKTKSKGGAVFDVDEGRMPVFVEAAMGMSGSGSSIWDSGHFLRVESLESSSGGYDRSDFFVGGVVSVRHHDCHQQNNYQLQYLCHLLFKQRSHNSSLFSLANTLPDSRSTIKQPQKQFSIECKMSNVGCGPCAGKSRASKSFIIELIFHDKRWVRRW